MSEVPTPEQFRRYREGRRDVVRNIAGGVKTDTIPLSEWARDTIARAREAHTASIRRQKKLVG